MFLILKKVKSSDKPSILSPADLRGSKLYFPNPSLQIQKKTTRLEWFLVVRTGIEPVFYP